ncbi:MAG: MFS transporter, partial [Candidatus Thermoplasmatota archaeon]|nr:MFS transporter [Candidatus Thermoplasmatota archaeon]MEC8446340.1 MFS transporter [Candidatus Thermoplasmatota archaeon]
NDISMPYLSYYAVRLGASFEQIAWIQSLMNLLPNALQYFWGWVSDTKLVRTYWIIGGSLFGAISLYLLSTVNDPNEMLFLVIIYSVSLSIINPTWAALQGDWMNPSKRGSTLSKFHVIGGLLGLVGSLIAVYSVYTDGSNSAEPFRPLFTFAAVATFVGGLILIRVPYRDPEKTKDLVLSETAKKEYSNTFQSYVRAQAFYALNMSLIWPLFAMILIEVLEVDNIVLVAFSLVGAVSEMAFQPIMGRLVDRVGPLPVLIMSRIGFAILPFIYAFFPIIEVMILLQIVILGPCFSAFLITSNAMVLDLAPNKERAAYFSYYNTRVGITTFVGALIGGYMAGYLEDFYSDTWKAIFTIFIISGIGRSIGTIPFLSLRIPKKYPGSIYLVDRLMEFRMFKRR